MPLVPDLPSTESPALLDIREASAFMAAHLPGSASIPLEELPRRVHELPDRGRGSSICLVDSEAARLQQAAAMLHDRGYVTSSRLLHPQECSQAGPATTWLWQPTPLLRQAVALQAASPARRPRAMDLACGAGREAAYLALSGYSVEALDVLPDALSRAVELAAHCGVMIHPIEADLRKNWPLIDGQYDLVCLFRFLHRPMLPRLPGLLRPGGMLVIETFCAASGPASSSERGGPINPARLLREGELRELFGQMDVLHLAEGVQRSGKLFGQLIARRKAT